MIEEEKMTKGTEIVEWLRSEFGLGTTRRGEKLIVEVIDEALRAARTKGEIAGAERMVEVVRKHFKKGGKDHAD
jgi:hypothetical protein